MLGIVLVSHGAFAPGLRDAIQMIAGDVPHLFAVSLLPEESPDDFTRKLSKIDLKAFDKILVFCDLLGGSPCNAAFMHFRADDRVSIVAGMNFAMVLTAVLSPDGRVEDIIEAGKMGIVDVRNYQALQQEDIDD